MSCWRREDLDAAAIVGLAIVGIAIVGLAVSSFGSYADEDNSTNCVEGNTYD